MHFDCQWFNILVMYSIVKVLSLTSNSSINVKLSLYTILRPFSSTLFVLSLVCLPWNIHTREQYLNCNSIKPLKRIRIFSNEGNLATVVKALSFLLAFKQILDTCLKVLKQPSQNFWPKILTPYFFYSKLNLTFLRSCCENIFKIVSIVSGKNMK